MTTLTAQSLNEFVEDLEVTDKYEDEWYGWEIYSNEEIEEYPETPWGPVEVVVLGGVILDRFNEKSEYLIVKVQDRYFKKVRPYDSWGSGIEWGISTYEVELRKVSREEWVQV